MTLIFQDLLVLQILLFLFPMEADVLSSKKDDHIDSLAINI